MKNWPLENKVAPCALSLGMAIAPFATSFADLENFCERHGGTVRGEIVEQAGATNVFNIYTEAGAGFADHVEAQNAAR